MAYLREEGSQRAQRKIRSLLMQPYQAFNAPRCRLLKRQTVCSRLETALLRLLLPDPP